ncbi:MAG TPA: response regulator transcription factor [Solirubrobacteraceae bacterium]
MLGRFSALVGCGLAQIVREDRGLRIVGLDLDSAALEHAVARRAPEVAIVDEPPAALAKPSLLEHLRKSNPETGVVVLAHRPPLAYGMRLLSVGASCVSKDASAADILAAVRVAADGRRVYASDDGHLVERSSPDLAARLTPRETEVFEYLSRARSHAEIAHALQLGVETVRTHSAHIRRKLGVRNNRELIGLPRPMPRSADTADAF